MSFLKTYINNIDSIYAADMLTIFVCTFAFFYSYIFKVKKTRIKKVKAQIFINEFNFINIYYFVILFTYIFYKIYVNLTKYIFNYIFNYFCI